MLKRNKLVSLSRNKPGTARPHDSLVESLKEVLPKSRFLAKDSKGKNETSGTSEDEILKEIMEKNRRLKEKVQENDQIVTNLIGKIEPKTLAHLVLQRKGGCEAIVQKQKSSEEKSLEPVKIKQEPVNGAEGKPPLKPKNFRIQSAPSEKFIRGLCKYDAKPKLMSHREKAQSIYQLVDHEKRHLSKRATESLHENNEFLATFNPNSSENLANLTEKQPAKEESNEIDCSNTPSFHTKHSQESSVSTNIENSSRVKQQRINKDFSFLDGNESGEEKKKSGFPKNIFQFMNKKHKFFV